MNHGEMEKVGLISRYFRTDMSYDYYLPERSLFVLYPKCAQPLHPHCVKTVSLEEFRNAQNQTQSELKGYLEN